MAPPNYIVGELSRYAVNIDLIAVQLDSRPDQPSCEELQALDTSRLHLQMALETLEDALTRSRRPPHLVGEVADRNLRDALRSSSTG